MPLKIHTYYAQDACRMVRAQARVLWVIAGKGPSFSVEKIAQAAKAGARVLALNHACLACPCHYAHFTDLLAFEDCAKTLLSGDCDVIIPWHPHQKNKPGLENLNDLARRLPALGQLSAEERLFTYNSSLYHGRDRFPGPSVYVRYFSAVAAFGLMAIAGVKKVATIGIDGGKDYAAVFNAWEARRLANKRQNFNIQFGELRRIAALQDIHWQRL